MQVPTNRQLRCSSRIQAVLIGEDLIEIKCNSKNCGAGNGTVVMHIYRLSTAELVDTRKFNSPDKWFQKVR